MRDIQKVISTIISLIPPGQKIRPYGCGRIGEWEPLIEELRKIRKRVPFLAPEVRGAAWAEMAEILYRHLGKPPFREPWMQIVCHIFSDTHQVIEEKDEADGEKLRMRKNQARQVMDDIRVEINKVRQQLSRLGDRLEWLNKAVSDLDSELLDYLDLLAYEKGEKP